MLELAWTAVGIAIGIWFIAMAWRIRAGNVRSGWPYSSASALLLGSALILMSLGLTCLIAGFVVVMRDMSRLPKSDSR